MFERRTQGFCLSRGRRCAAAACLAPAAFLVLLFIGGCTRWQEAETLVGEIRREVRREERLWVPEHDPRVARLKRLLPEAVEAIEEWLAATDARDRAVAAVLALELPVPRFEETIAAVALKGLPARIKLAPPEARLRAVKAMGQWKSGKLAAALAVLLTVPPGSEAEGSKAREKELFSRPEYREAIAAQGTELYEPLLGCLERGLSGRWLCPGVLELLAGAFRENPEVRGIVFFLELVNAAPTPEAAEQCAAVAIASLPYAGPRGERAAAALLLEGGFPSQRRAQLAAAALDAFVSHLGGRGTFDEHWTRMARQKPEVLNGFRGVLEAALKAGDAALKRTVASQGLKPYVFSSAAHLLMAQDCELSEATRRTSLFYLSEKAPTAPEARRGLIQLLDSPDEWLVRSAVLSLQGQGLAGAPASLPEKPAREQLRQTAGAWRQYLRQLEGPKPAAP